MLIRCLPNHGSRQTPTGRPTWWGSLWVVDLLTRRDRDVFWATPHTGVIALGKKRGRALVLDILIGAGWLAFATLYIGPVLHGGRLIDVGRLVYILILAVLFVMRDPARKSGATWESLLALLGTFLPVVVLKPAGGGPAWLGEAIQTIGLAGMLAAVVSLGGGFGIAPADRGLRTTGLYRWVRHPLYAAELWFYTGYLIANPTFRNLIGLTVGTLIQIVRIGLEERILAGYTSYAQHVRYRLVPFVW